jgi:hypothetical protein
VVHRSIRSAVLILMVVFAAASHAQIRNRDADWSDRQAFGVEVAKPLFENGETMMTGAAYLTWQQPFRDRIMLHFDLPMASGEFQNDSLSNGGESTLGNPYIGIEYKYRDDVWISGGLRIPLAQDNTAGFIGIYSDYSRVDAFAEGRWSIGGLVRHKRQIVGWTSLEIWGGSTIMFTPDPGILQADTTQADHFDIMVDWGIHVWEGSLVRYGVGFVGRTILTQGGSLSDHTRAQFNIEVTTIAGRLRPSLYARLPLDATLSDILDLVLGAKLVWAFD